MTTTTTTTAKYRDRAKAMHVYCPGAGQVYTRWCTTQRYRVMLIVRILCRCMQRIQLLGWMHRTDAMAGVRVTIIDGGNVVYMPDLT